MEILIQAAPKDAEVGSKAATDEHRRLATSGTSPGSRPAASLFALGLAAHREGKYELALDKLGQAITEEPTNADYYWHRAMTFSALKRLSEAVEDYREAVRLQPDSAAFQNDLGVALAREGRRDEAAERYREAIRIRPDFPDAHNNLGNTLRLKGELDAAVACYHEALGLRPIYPEAYNNLGIALRNQGKLAESVTAYNEALRLRPTYAEAHNNLGFALVAQGRADAALCCYEQAIRLRPDYAEAIANKAAALLSLNRHADAADTYRQAIRFRPDDARAHKCLGIALSRLKSYEEAIAAYREAIRIRPDYSDAHNDLGIALAQQKRFDEAAGSYRQALAHRPHYAEAHNNLGNALRNLGKFDEALSAYNRAIELKPNYADAYSNRGIAYAEIARFDEAVDSYTRCLRLRPHHVDAHVNRALTWLRQGNFAQGWAEYEWRLRKRNAGARTPIQPSWNGFPPEGLRILLTAEQGLGDSLQFIRYAQQLKRLGATVFFECPERLVKLLERTPGIDRLVIQGQELPEHDVQVPLLSVPGLVGTALGSVPAEVPYIHADPEHIKLWSGELAAYPEFKVGINWQGNPEYAGDYHRSVPLRHFAPLASVPGVRLFSLQMIHGTEQLKELGGAFPVVNLAGKFDGVARPFLDSAAVLKSLDLFVTSDTAVAHLAGALGVPVWLVLSAAPGWQWMVGRTDSPWYPTMRLFRQEKLGEWPPVFERIARELAAVVPPALRLRSIGVRVSAGELIERIAMLELEIDGPGEDPERQAARADLAHYRAILGATVPDTPELSDLTRQMRDATRRMHAAEQLVRSCERSGDFGPQFVEQARAMMTARQTCESLRQRIDARGFSMPNSVNDHAEPTPFKVSA
jgi:tetratricopeptide (TPR) repeat protein